MTDYSPPPLLFIDCETIHLEPFEGSMWELAFMRLDDDVPQTFTFSPLLSLADPQALEISRYDERFDIDRATPRVAVVDALEKALADRPALAGSAPWFDANHIAANFAGVAGMWHHHHLDVPTLVAGATYEGDPEPPWRLSQAARWADIDPDAYDRHTAAGDVLLARDLYRAWRTGA